MKLEIRLLIIDMDGKVSENMSVFYPSDDAAQAVVDAVNKAAALAIESGTKFRLYGEG